MYLKVEAYNRSNELVADVPKIEWFDEFLPEGLRCSAVAGYRIGFRFLVVGRPVVENVLTI